MGFLDRLFRRAAPPLPVAAEAPDSTQSPRETKYAYVLERANHDDGQGLILRRVADGQGLSWRTLPRRDGFEAISLAGVSHRREALQSPKFDPGRVLTLVPEPENPHDRNAIGVWDRNRKLQAGWIPKDQAARIGKKLAQGEYQRCLSMWETRKAGDRVALRVLLLSDEASLDWEAFAK